MARKRKATREPEEEEDCRNQSDEPQRSQSAEPERDNECGSERNSGGDEHEETMSVKGEVLVEISKGVESMLFRRSPKLFSNMVKALNSSQKKAVVEMGFGAILNFKLDYLPPRLCYWVASFFNPLTGSLPISPGVSGQHIDEVDVHLTLGFPKGKEPMKRKIRQSNLTLLEEIATKLKKKRKHLNPEDIQSILLKEEAGGDYFKKVFLLMLEYWFPMVVLSSEWREYDAVPET